MYNPDWNWTYTITVSNGDLNDVESFEIFNVAGFLVRSTNETDPCFQCSLDGFVIESILGNKGMANYAPMSATPEPASVFRRPESAPAAERAPAIEKSRRIQPHDWIS